MKILITGAGGFVAREVTRELEEGGHDLRLTDKPPREDVTYFDSNTGGRVAKPLQSKAPYVRGDILSLDDMLKVVDGMDAVVHLAAIPQGFPDQGVATFLVNAQGTFVVLVACRRAKVKRFVLASSINAFGTFYWRISGRPPVFDKLPLTEDFDPVVEDPYSLSKLVGEQTCAAFHRAYGITTAAMRFAGVWSRELYEEFRSKGLPPTTEWPDHFLQWVHIADVAIAIRQALEAPNLPGHGVYTLVADDTRCPEPTMEILKRLRPDLRRVLTRELKGREPLLSNAAAKRAFGFAPRYRLGD
jgi:nucleoside-diphosphate-sugar epimerase